MNVVVHGMETKVGGDHNSLCISDKTGVAIDGHTLGKKKTRRH